MHRVHRLLAVLVCLFTAKLSVADKPADAAPSPESKGGWRSLLGGNAEPDAEHKAQIAKIGGCRVIGVAGGEMRN